MWLDKIRVETEVAHYRRAHSHPRSVDGSVNDFRLVLRKRFRVHHAIFDRLNIIRLSFGRDIFYAGHIRFEKFVHFFPFDFFHLGNNALGVGAYCLCTVREIDFVAVVVRRVVGSRNDDSSRSFEPAYREGKLWRRARGIEYKRLASEARPYRRRELAESL